MSNIITSLLPNVIQNSPASNITISELISQVSLPSDYIDILRIANGLEGDVDDNAYLRLWKAEELIISNEEYHSEEFTPGFFLIGSDGGDTAFGLDIRPSSSTYGSYLSRPFIAVGWREVQILGNTFSNFVEALKKGTY